MRGPPSSGMVRVAFLTRMDNPRFSREGETALSPERSLGWPLVAAKEGVLGGTMGSPTPGDDSIVDSVRAAAS
jgi:hypothetical protein